MRWWLVGIALATLAGCSKAPNGSVGEPDVAGNASAGVAFTYGYSLMLPSSRIADLQEAHARSCERLGASRCRITGLRYTVGSQGGVDASLSVKVAAPLARAFGRAGIKLAESVGASLTGADITGTDVGTDAAATATERTDVDTERGRLAGELGRTGLPAAERAELLRQHAALAERASAARASAADQRESLASTPMTFTYATGRGTGLVDRFRDAGDTALGSIGFTVTVLLWIVAALGPPALVVALIFLLWRRWGRYWWARSVDRIGAARETAADRSDPAR